MAEVGSLFVRLGLKSQEFTQGLKKATKSVAKLSINIAKMGAKIASATAGAGALAGAFVFKKSINEFANFESALIDMGKVTSESFESIKTKIMALDSSLGSSTELMRGYYQVISAGVKEPKRAIETLVTASKAAKAAHVEQAEVIKGLTKIMAGYEGEIKTVSEAADLLFAIEKEGQTSVQELIPVIGGLAKMSHDLGVSQQELGASLAVITQTAGSTAEAATQYQAVLMALLKPTTEMKKAIKEFGYESTQAMVAELGLAETLKKLKEYTGGSAQMMAALFGRVEGLKGMSALAAKDFEVLAATTKEIGKSAGSAEQAWQRYKNTLEAIWATFKNTIGKQAILIGEQLAPTVKEILIAMSRWIEKNKELIVTGVSQWISQLVKHIRTLSENLDTLIPYIKSMIKVISTLVGWFVSLGKWLGETAAKIVIVGEKIAAFVKKWKGKTIDFIMNFMGKGSTIKPLTEKIEEINGKVTDFADMVNNTKPQLTIDATPATKALERLRQQHENVISSMIEKYAKLGYQYELASPGFTPLGYLTGEKQARWRRSIGQEERRWERIQSEVGRFSSMRNINITIAPTYMTGDRNAAKNVAREIWNEISDMRYRGVLQ